MSTRSIITDICDGCGVEHERVVEGHHDGAPDGWSTLSMERPIRTEDPIERAAVQAAIANGGDPDPVRAYFADLRAHGISGGSQSLHVSADLCPACMNGGDYRAILERLACKAIEEHEAKLQQQPGMMFEVFEGDPIPRPADLSFLDTDDLP